MGGTYLNATYFRARGVKVMGSIFNRLPNDPNHFYSLENCKKAVSSYFKKDKLDEDDASPPTHKEEVFGFVPEVEGLSSNSIESAKRFIDLFSKHVSVSRILEHAIEMRDSGYTMYTNSDGNTSSTKRKSSENNTGSTNNEIRVRKKMRQSSIQQGNSKILLSREEIENAAKSEGAAGG